jgi:hypothetical protein
VGAIPVVSANEHKATDLAGIARGKTKPYEDKERSYYVLIILEDLLTEKAHFKPLLS